MLVVGATGVLRPAVLTLLLAGHPVVAIARRSGPLAALAAAGGPGCRCLAVDVTDPQAVSAAAAGPLLRDGVGAALIYPAGDDAVQNTALDQLAPVVTGSTVRLLTSGWTPAVGPALAGRWPRAPGRLHLLLGVATTPDGGDRWHSPGEISAAALRVLRTGTDAVLGRPLRPRDRPPVR